MRTKILYMSISPNILGCNSIRGYVSMCEDLYSPDSKTKLINKHAMLVVVWVPALKSRILEGSHSAVYFDFEIAYRVEVYRISILQYSTDNTIQYTVEPEVVNNCYRSQQRNTSCTYTGTSPEASSSGAALRCWSMPSRASPRWRRYNEQSPCHCRPVYHSIFVNK